MPARTYGAVAIGRNEGERLRRCLASLSTATAIVYVDSCSEDGSAAWARANGADVVELDMTKPFTAARARNAGLKQLQEIAPQVPYVQFVDADCTLDARWPATAAAFLNAHSGVAVVSGRRRERHPERSVYNWLCEREWDGAPGETRACGGDAMMRVAALQSVGGFRGEMIAGEEPELCVRLRAKGWKIWRIGADMTLHDADMSRLTQWMSRSTRAGYAFAEGAHLHGDKPERHWVWESRRAWLWGAGIPVACLALSLAWPPWGLAAWLVYPAQILRQTLRNPGTISERATLALFQGLARFPEAWGQIRFAADRLLGRQGRLIEYK